jgi:hypothetical protein
MPLQTWIHWQMEVVEAIRELYHDVFSDIEFSDIDWSAWRPLYEEGRSPLAAVSRAFVLDF